MVRWAAMNVGRMLETTARRLPGHPAVTWGSRELTYAEFDRRTNTLAHGLASLGVRGDRVGVLMRNRPELLEAMYACFKAGYCLVPLNSRFTTDDVAYHVADSAAAAVLTDAEGAAVVVGAEIGGVSVVVAGADDRPEGTHDHDALVADSDDAYAVVSLDRDALAWLFYTSGTTGRPKGAMLTHGNLSFVTASWLADLTPMTDADVTLHAAPLSHGAGFHALAAIARGARQVIPWTAVEPDAILELLARERVTNTWMVPTQIVMLIDAAAEQAERRDAPRPAPRGLRRGAVRARRPEAGARGVRAGVRAALRSGRDADDGDVPARGRSRRHARGRVSRAPGVGGLRGPGWTCGCSATTTASSRPVTSARCACRARR